jgi:hypothetical protein
MTGGQRVVHIGAPKIGIHNLDVLVYCPMSLKRLEAHRRPACNNEVEARTAIHASVYVLSVEPVYPVTG